MDLPKICRICLKSDLLVSIYSPTFLLRPIEMIEKLNIFKVDDLSKFLCQSCLYHIIHLTKELANLQQLASASERQLNQYKLSHINHDLGNNSLQAIEAKDISNFQNEHRPLFSEIFHASEVPDNGKDDMINEVEIDVSSLTRSEADDTLSEVFVDAQINCHYDTDVQEYNDDIVEDNATVLENVLVTKAIVSSKTDQKTRKIKLKATEKCFDCGKTFSTPGYLTKHKRLHTGDKPFKCNICSRRFTYLSNLRLHHQVHSGTRRFQCEVCAKFFTTSSNLKAHSLTHTEERAHQCGRCEKRFKSARELRRHKPIHSKNKTHLCDSCQKTFSKRCYLRAHILSVHQSDKKYECKNCHKTFATISNFKCHMRIHTGEKPYQCKHCPWKFNQSSALLRHIQKKHPICADKELRPTESSITQAVNLAFHLPERSIPLLQSNAEQIIITSNDGYEFNKLTLPFYGPPN